MDAPTGPQYRHLSTPLPSHQSCVALRHMAVNFCVHRRRGFALLPALWTLALLSLSATAEGAPPAWQLETSEKGVKVFTRPGPGGGFPEFRGETTIRAGVFEILAVLDDIDSACEWTQRCAASRQLKRHSPIHRIFYNRTAVPWPLQDRDAVLEGTVSGMAKGDDVVASFRSVTWPGVPARSGVVRMPILEGAYRVQRVAEGASRVSLRIRAHPGGIIPDWLAKWMARRIPVDTLDGLRRQVARSGSRYAAFVQRHDARRQPVPLAGQVSSTSQP